MRGATKPPYLSLYRTGELSRRAALAQASLGGCRLCPRSCQARRDLDVAGDCGVGRKAVVASAFPHFGEEECLTGRCGSGTLFFGGCNLHCLFCQNFEISWQMAGRALDAREIAGLMLNLQEQGCHNLNLVTPSHVVAQILEALLLAVPEGFYLPVVFNTSAYDRVETLQLLDGVVSIYMPDLKFADDAVAGRLTCSADYASVARDAIREMHRQVGDLKISGEGLAVSGLLVRHLVMPADLAGTRAAMDFLAREISPDTFVNVMAQYRPCGLARQKAGLDRRVSRGELVAAYQAAYDAGIHRFAVPPEELVHPPYLL